LHTNVSNLNSISSTDVFVPVLPPWRTHQEDDKVNNQGLVHLLDISSPGSPLLPLTDITKFLNEQCRSLDDAANKATNVAQSSSQQQKPSVFCTACISDPFKSFGATAWTTLKKCYMINWLQQLEKRQSLICSVYHLPLP
jgi:hypothetical protein